jgi:hypothetical protein
VYYLYRQGQPDPEGPYSFEYLKNLSREGRLFADDRLEPTDGSPSFHAGEVLEFGPLQNYVSPGIEPEETIHRPPTYPESKPTNSSVSPSTIGVLIAIALVSLCCVPGLIFMRPAAGEAGGLGSIGGGSGSVDSMTSIRRVTRAAIAYCSDNDGLYPPGMDSDEWRNQLQPYLEPGQSDLGKLKSIKANPNLSGIRRGSIIDPYRTLMFYSTDSAFGGQTAVSNSEGQVAFIESRLVDEAVKKNLYYIDIR